MKNNPDGVIDERMGVRIRIWLEKEGDLVFGSGRRDLLRMIRDLGSLHKAAKELAMSYRAAWGKIRNTEQSLGWNLVKVVGKRKHMALTPDAEDFLERFIRFEKEADELVRDLFQKQFPDYGNTASEHGRESESSKGEQ